MDPARDPWPLLVTTVLNLARDTRRKRQRQSIPDRVRDESIVAAHSQGEPDPSHEALRAERDTYVHRALQQLPGEQREAVLLREYEGLSHREIGSLLGCTALVARKRYSRGISALGKMLKGVLE